MIAALVVALALTALPNATASVNAATASLALTASPSTPTAGTPFSLTVTALDENGNTDPTYTGTLHFTTNDTSPDAVLPVDSQLTNGQGTFSATLVHAGSWWTITVSDTATSMSATVQLTVMAAEASSLDVMLRGNPTAGYGPFFRIYALDRFNNNTHAYQGTLHFTTSDASPMTVLPPDSTFCCGIRDYGAILCTAGSQTITATDTADPSITGTLAVTMRPGPTARVRLDAPSTAKMAQPFEFTLSLLDRCGNVATGAVVPYTGTIHFTSSDPRALLPPDYEFNQSYSTTDSGIRIFSATLMMPGDQTITATDSATPSITGTSSNIGVTCRSHTEQNSRSSGRW